MTNRIIYTEKHYRIVELPDLYPDMSCLKGDCFNPEVNPDIDLETLRKEERNFEREVELNGVYGYILERWNPEIGRGWEHVDSCHGFIGRYDVSAPHYIVEEFKHWIEEN